MRFLGTKSSLPLSKAITILSGDDCSHFAVHFEALGLVLHSNLVGIHCDLDDIFFSDKVKVVHDIKIDMGLVQEVKALREFQKNLKARVQERKSGYDMGALFYQGWALVLWRLFKKPIPQKNEWANRDRFLCTELYDMLPDWIYPVVLEFEDMGMVRPSQMFAFWGSRKPV